jgi:site-specific recombinase XerD
MGVYRPFYFGVFLLFREREKNMGYESQLVLSGSAYNNFADTIKSQITLENYSRALRRYMQYCNITDVNNLLSFQLHDAQQRIIDYISYLKQCKQLSAITISQYVAAIIHFYTMNDVTLNRNKIGCYIPEYIKRHKDRAYTRAEVSKLLEFCDLRGRAIVLLLASTGMRIGAVPPLTLEHITKVSKYGLSLYQITVYAGCKEEYICFCTF